MLRVGALLLALASPAVEAPVQLPAFVVRDTRVLPAPSHWRYAAVPGFEVLASGAAADAGALTGHFLQFHRAIDALWPVAAMNAAVPAELIFCADAERFAPFVPVGTRARAEQVLSAAYQDFEMAAFAVNLDPAAQTGDGTSSDILQREYIHFVLGRIGERVPEWLRQGLWQMLSGMRCEGASVSIAGAPGTEKTPPQLTDIFAPGHFATDDTSSEWSKECFAFAHYCLLGEPARYRLAFYTFARRASRQASNESLFQSCFGQSYAEFQKGFSGYHGFASGVGFTLRGPAGTPLPPLPEPRFRAATDAQVGRITGEALRMAGKPEDAHWALIAPYQRGARDPQLLASLGLQEVAAGQNRRARQFLEAAAAGGTSRARAWLELGRLRLQELTSGLPPAGRLNADQMALVLAPLFAARQLLPPLPEVYRTIAEAWLRSQIPPTAGHLGVIDEGLKLFPDDARLQHLRRLLESSRPSRGRS